MFSGTKVGGSLIVTCNINNAGVVKYDGTNLWGCVNKSGTCEWLKLHQ